MYRTDPPADHRCYNAEMEKAPFQFSLGQLLTAMPLFGIAALTLTECLRPTNTFAPEMLPIASLVSFGAGVVFLFTRSIRGMAIVFLAGLICLSAALLGKR